MKSNLGIVKYLILVALFFPIIALAARQPLPVDQAFVLQTHLKQDNILVATWQIVPGYYLYKDRFQFRLLDNSAAQLAQAIMPKGKAHQDDIFGQYEIYQDQVALHLPIVSHSTSQARIAITYQGCSSEGFCYPPTTKEIALTLNTSNSNKGIDSLINSDKVIFITLGFLILGILLAFTPCVFPMLPILSSIILGADKNLTTRKAFSLSLTYVLAMAVSYACAGLVIGLVGFNLQSALQHPIVISGFCILLILLALSLFGLYELQLPSSWQEKIMAVSNRQKSGTYVGAAIMGLLSALIVSPCVSAPLVGALSYISQQNNPWLGGSALLALGLGMGIPLLIFGTFGGSLLPKAGTWMDTIKALFGFALIGLAIWMVERVIPAAISIWLWGSLFTVTGIYLSASKLTPTLKNKLWKGLYIIISLYGIGIMFTAIKGNTNPWQLYPITYVKDNDETNTIAFTPVKTIADIQQVLQNAKQQQKVVMLDFYADWCINCKRMEKTVFNDSIIKSAFNHMLLFRVDITDTNDKKVQQILKHFNVIAPPTLILFDASGNEHKERRVIGEINAKELSKRLNFSVKCC